MQSVVKDRSIIARCASLTIVTSRRAFLTAVGMLGLGALTGCAMSNPVIDDPSGTPRAAGGTIPFRDDGLQILSQIEGRASALASAASLTSGQQKLRAWIVTAAQSQRSALQRGAPYTSGSSAPPTSASPAAVSGDWNGLIGALKQAQVTEAKFAAQCDGLNSLTWASMAAWAGSVAAHASGSSALSTTTTPAKPVTATEKRALADVIAQIHALVFGSELALVPLSRSDSAYATVNTAWSTWQQRRDTLSTTLRSLGGEVPGSQEPYDIAAPTSAAAAVSLVGSLETSFLATAGTWVAAAEESRPEAVALLASAASEAVTHGGPLQVWPGWPPAP